MTNKKEGNEIPTSERKETMQPENGGKDKVAKKKEENDRMDKETKR